MSEKIISNFVLKDKYSSFIKCELEKSLKSGYSDLDNEMIDTSDISKCDRRIYYKMINNSIFGTNHQKMSHKYLVLKWKEILSNIQGIEVLKENLLVADQNYDLKSVVQLVASIDDVPSVIMIREVNSELFKQEKLRRSDVIDIMSQMWLAELNDGFLIYEDMESKNNVVFHILPNTSILNGVKEKVKALGMAKISGMVPDRKYETQSKECRICIFREKCWNEESGTFFGGVQQV